MSSVAAVVCLHGLGRSPRDWEGIAPGLRTFGPVVAPQLPRDRSAAAQQAAQAVEPGSIVVGHSLGAILALGLADQRSSQLRALVLTGCFFPPARNGRDTVASVRDYLAHRLAYLRSLDRRGPSNDSRAQTAGALASLARQAMRRGDFYAELGRVRCPVLVVHARDDHHVPVDFALAAVERTPTWQLRVLEHGGHHAHVTRPRDWLEAVGPWLGGIAPRRP